MRVTLKEIAKEANISLATTSLILNNKPVRAAQATKQNVLAIAKKYNYRPNKVAQGLVTKRSMTVGFIIPDISNTFFAEAAKHIELEFSNHGYNLILCNTNDCTSWQKKSIENLLSRGIDALVICLAQKSFEDAEVIEQIKHLDVPCVAFDRWNDAIPCFTVSVDNILGAEMATEHLVELGHKKIGCITGVLSSISAKQRFEGYKNVMKKHQIEFDSSLVFEGDYKYGSGFDGAKHLLKQGVSAIFACNDLMAYGTMRAAKELNISIPNQLSVIGFDDLFFSATSEIPLTTIRQPIKQLSQMVADKVLHLLQGNTEISKILLPPALVVRESSKKLDSTK